MTNEKIPLRSRSWFIVLFLVFFFPIGLVLMWAQEPKSKILGNTGARVVLTIFFTILLLGSIGSDGSHPRDTQTDPSFSRTPPSENVVLPDAKSVRQATREKTPPPAPKKKALPKGVTRETFDAIKTGMSLDDVEAMLGKSSTMSVSDTPGIGKVEMYQWSDIGILGSGGKTITVFLMNRKVSDKNWVEF